MASYKMEGGMPTGMPYGQGMPSGQQMLQQQPQQQLHSQPGKLGPKGALPWQTEEERKAERGELRAILRSRKEKEDFYATESTIKWICSLGTINSFLLCVPMFGNSWLFKGFIGAGIKRLIIRISMFYIHVTVECGKNWVEDKFCHGFVEKMKGSHTLQDATHMACAVNNVLAGGSACEMMSRAYMLSLMLFGFFSVAIISNLCGVMFLSHYWYSKPVPRIRQWALFFHAMAAMCAVGGFGMWGLFKPEIENLPRAWTDKTLTLGGGVGELFAIKPAPGIPFGWCAILGVFIVISYVVQFLLWPAWFVPHEKEEEAVLNEELAHEHLEQRIQDLQGSMLPGSAQAAPDILQWYGAPSR